MNKPSIDIVKSLYDGLTQSGYKPDELWGGVQQMKEHLRDETTRKLFYNQIARDGRFEIGDYEYYQDQMGQAYSQQSSMPELVNGLPQKPKLPNQIAIEDKLSLRGALDNPIKLPKSQGDGGIKLKSQITLDPKFGKPQLEPVRTPMEGVPSPIGGYVDASTGEAIAPDDPRLKEAVLADPNAPSVDLTLDGVEQERNRLDALLRDRGRQVNEQFRQSQGGFLASLAEAVRSGQPGGVTNTLAYQTGEGVYTDEQYNTLAATKETYDNISALMREYETARKENKLDQWAITKFGKGLGRGLSDEASKERAWENLSSVAALSVAGKDNAYTKAVADYEAGNELTPEQESLLEAKAKEMYAIHTLSSGTGSGYDIGSGAAGSLLFITEIALGGGIKGAGRKAATGVARWMLEKHGIKATKGLLGKIARYGAGAIAEAGASIPTALITGSAGIASDAHRRNIGDATYKIDDISGKIQYAGNEGGEWLGTSLAKSVTARAIEHFTEGAVGGVLDEAVGFIGKGARSVLAKSTAGQRLLGALEGLAKNPVAAEVGNLADRVQLNNVFSEYGEEVIAGAINALAVGDQTLDTAEGTGVFNTDNLIDTAISVALVSGAFGAAGAVGYRTPRARAKQAMLNSSRGVLAQFPDPSIHASIISAIDNGSTEQVRNLLSSVSTDPEMTEAQRRAVFTYAKDALYYRSAYNASKRDEDDVTAISRDNYEDGYGLSDAQELNNARVNYEYRRRKLAEAMGIPPEQAQGMLFDDPARAINVLSKDGSLTDDQRERAIAYLNAKAKYDGVIDRVQDDIDDSVSKASERIKANAHDSGRMIKATLRDGRQVYIKSGNIVMNDDGTMVNTSASDQEIFVVDAETGKVSMTSPSNISSIDEDMDAGEYRAKIEGEISSSIAGERANMIEGAVIPVKGDSYTLADGDGNNMTALVTEVFPDGSLVVQHEDGSLMPLTGEAFQSMARPAQQAQIEASLDEADQADAQVAQYSIGDVVGLSLEDGTQVEAEVVEEADADGRIGVLMTMPDGRQVMSSLSADQMRTMATTKSESVEDGGISVSEADNTTPEQPPQQESKSPEETEWDSLIEQAEGDKDTARMTAEAMVVNMRDEVARAEKELSKKTKGRTPQEVMQEVKERKAALNEAKQSLSYWETVASVEAAREAQAKAEAQAEARAKAEAEAEIERKAREEFSGVPDWSNDTAQDARARGYRRNGSERIDRNGVVRGVSGSDVKVRFSNDISVPAQYVVIEASDLQPSHIQGMRNPRFFLDEAQPKDRADEVSAVSAQRIAASIRPEEIAGAPTAYTGAPVVNGRGEVIQGNNRGDALRYMYESAPRQADVYRRYIEEHASDFGLDVNALRDMSNPVLVRVANIPDAEAIKLGQYTSQDTESGGVELSQAESRVSEYTELMRKELEDKEAKYADLGNGDSFSLDSDLLEDDDETRFRDGDEERSMVHLSYASRAQELGRELGVPVRVVHDTESIKYPNKSVQARMRKAKGWFDIKTGEIVVVVPNASSISDVEATIYHEAVGHKGLREVVGDKDFDAFLREVYKGLPKDAQWAVASDFLSGKYKSLEEATEEYIARLAERGFSEDRSVLRKVIDKLRYLLRNVLGVKLPFTENDLRYMLWRSYHLRQHQGAIQVAEDIAMQMNLGVGRFRDSSASPYDAEMEQIKADAQANSTFMLAPNGKPTKLNERQWLQVRTQAFKDWFGDWEKSARIEKLRRSEPVEITGTEIEPSDDLKQYKKNALEYGKRLQGSYVNQDTGKTISLQRGRKRGGVNEVLQHDYKDAEHLQSIAAIPSIIEQAIYIDSVTNEDNKVDADSFDYYVAGVQIAGVDYTVRAVVVNTKNGETYYDHKLSSIEKGNLLDLMTGQGDNHRDFGTTPDPKSTITDISDVKDTKLVSLLRNDASKVVDENGEPMVVYHGTRELFTSFDRDYKGLNHEDIENSKAGFFFTDSIEEAEYYTERTDNDGRERSGSTPSVMPVFLSLMDPEVYSTRNDAAYELDNDAYALSYEENGSDGIIVRGRDNSVYVAFEPTQIKSATDNVGAFDGENADIRFRDGEDGDSRVGQARREYNRAVRVTNADGKKVARANIGHRLREAYQDSMLALKKMQEAIARESGRGVESFEDAYLAENSMSSKNKVQAEKYERDFFNPLAGSIAGLMDQGASYQEIKEYMYAKHGLERNEYYSRKRGGNNWGGKITDYSGLSSLTGDNVLFTDIATKMVDDFERKYDTSDLWDKVKRATRETLKISYKAGMMSRDTYESVQDMFSYYIPLRGWDEKTASSEYDYISTGMPMYSPTLKTVKGRKSLADDPIATIGFMAESAIIQGNRNRMKQRLLNLAMNTNTNLLTVQKQWYVLDNKTGEWEQASPDISENASPDEVQQSIMAFEDRMQALANKGLAKQERNGLNVGVRALDREKKQHQVHVRVNGREYIVYVNGNPRAAQAVNGLTNPNIVGSGDSPWKWAKEKAQFVKNTMAQLFTSKNPAFIATNLARDIVWAGSAVLIKENGEYAIRYTKNVTTMLAKGKPLSLLYKYKSGSLDESVKLEKYFDEFLTYGGETGFTQINNVDEYKKKIKRFVNDKEGWKSANGVKHARAGWHAVMGAIEFGNRASEDLTRFAVFVTSRQMGRSIDRSISDAKEVTVNFNRKGSGGYGAALAGFAYIFFNASVQSLANAGKLLSQHKGKSAALIGSVLFSGAITPFVYEAMRGLLGDDDEPSYWDIPEWVRRNNLIFYVPFIGGKYISVPLPHELRSFYGAGESAVSALLGKETIEDAMVKSAKGFADMLPLDFTGNGGSLVTNLTPTILQPLAQAYLVNKNYFGVPIYKDSQYLEDFPDWKKSYKGTNKFAVNMAKYINELTGGDNVRKGWIDINPAIMEHMFESYLGGTGQTINQAAKTISMIWDEDARSVNTIPIINKFIRQMDERSSTVSQINRDYYKAVEELEEFERVGSGYKKEMLTAPDQSSRDEYKQKFIDHWESDQAKRRYGILHRYVNAIRSLSKSREMFLDQGNKDKIDESIKRLKIEMLDKLEESSVGA